MQFSIKNHLWERTNELGYGLLYWTIIHITCKSLADYSYRRLQVVNFILTHITILQQAFFLLCQALCVFFTHDNIPSWWIGQPVLYPVSILTTSYFLFSFNPKQLDSYLMIWHWIILGHYFQYGVPLTIYMSILYLGLYYYPLSKTWYFVSWIILLNAWTMGWWNCYFVNADGYKGHHHQPSYPPPTLGSLHLSIYLFHSWWYSVGVLILSMIVHKWKQFDNDKN